MNTIPIRTATARHGLHLRGSFAVDAADDIPPVNGRPAKSLLLFGNTGSSMWESFSNSDEYHDGNPDPLNRWSERIGSSIAAQFGAVALFPFGGPPHRPFLRWGKKAEALRNSQIGMLMHPQFGLWHSYRFALAFADAVDGAHSASIGGGDLCGACADKPCLRACPVGAFGADGYDVQACFGYLQDHPDSRCMNEGCQARVACPQGAEHRYRRAHAAFHMRAFVIAMACEEFAGNPHERSASAR